MKQILLISHGYMAYGTHEATKMIIGDVNYLNHVCFSSDKDVEVFKKELREKLVDIKDSEQIIVVADLLGGSPYTSALTLLEELEILDKSIVITGMNLALVMQIALTEATLKKTKLKNMIEESKSSIIMYEQISDTEDDEDL